MNNITEKLRIKSSIYLHYYIVSNPKNFININPNNLPHVSQKRGKRNPRLFLDGR